MGEDEAGGFFCFRTIITIILTSTVYHCAKKIKCLKPLLKGLFVILCRAVHEVYTGQISTNYKKTPFRWGMVSLTAAAMKSAQTCGSVLRVAHLIRSSLKGSSIYSSREK